MTDTTTPDVVSNLWAVNVQLTGNVQAGSAAEAVSAAVADLGRLTVESVNAHRLGEHHQRAMAAMRSSTPPAAALVIPDPEPHDPQ